MSAPAPERAPAGNVDVVELPDPDAVLPCFKITEVAPDGTVIWKCPGEPAAWRVVMTCPRGHRTTRFLGVACWSRLQATLAGPVRTWLTRAGAPRWAAGPTMRCPTCGDLSGRANVTATHL